jgi:hypothetical protein
MSSLTQNLASTEFARKSRKVIFLLKKFQFSNIFYSKTQHKILYKPFNNPKKLEITQKNQINWKKYKLNLISFSMDI